MSEITQGVKAIYEGIEEMQQADAINQKELNDMIDSAMNETEIEFEAEALARQQKALARQQKALAQGLDATTIDTKFDRDYDQIVKAKLENVKEEYRNETNDTVDFKVKKIKSLKEIFKDALQIDHLKHYEEYLDIVSDFENDLAKTMTENVRVGWGKVQGKNSLVTAPVMLESEEAKKLIETRFTPLLSKVYDKVKEKYQAFKKKDNFEKAVKKLDALWNKERKLQSRLSMFSPSNSKVVSNPERIKQAISAIIEGEDVHSALSDVSDGFRGSRTFTKAIEEFKKAYEAFGDNQDDRASNVKALYANASSDNAGTHSRDSGSTDVESRSSEAPENFKDFLNSELEGYKRLSIRGTIDWGKR